MKSSLEKVRLYCYSSFSFSDSKQFFKTWIPTTIHVKSVVGACVARLLFLMRESFGFQEEVYSSLATPVNAHFLVYLCKRENDNLHSK